MSGYRAWGSEGVAAAKRASRAAAARDRAEKRAEYDEYRAEARACGYEVESFEEWMGEVSPRERAEERVMGGRSYSEWSYYADLY